MFFDVFLCFLMFFDVFFMFFEVFRGFSRFLESQRAHLTHDYHTPPFFISTDATAYRSCQKCVTLLSPNSPHSHDSARICTPLNHLNLTLFDVFDVSTTFRRPRRKIHVSTTFRRPRRKVHVSTTFRRPRRKVDVSTTFRRPRRKVHVSTNETSLSLP